MWIRGCSGRGRRTEGATAPAAGRIRPPDWLIETRAAHAMSTMQLIAYSILALMRGRQKLVDDLARYQTLRKLTTDERRAMRSTTGSPRSRTVWRRWISRWEAIIGAGISG
jgi:hypothetical protein